MCNSIPLIYLDAIIHPCPNITQFTDLTEHKFLLLHYGYSIVSRVSISDVILAPDFSNYADFRQLQISSAQTKYKEILTINTETPDNTTRKIAK